jgi:nucleotide-binding universal stress UspA family protein
MPARPVIVFPTDFSDLSVGAVPWLERLQRDLDADIHCVHVVQQPAPYTMLELGTVPLPTQAQLVDGAAQALQGFVARRLAGLRVSHVQVVTGRPAEAICEYAAAAGATLIVVTTHGYGGLRRAVLGSTTEAILRQSRCPVLSVPSR